MRMGYRALQYNAGAVVYYTALLYTSDYTV